MSDFIAGLRSDLVEAAASHASRGRVARRALPLRPRGWSRPALAATAAAAACALAVVIAVSAVGPPSRTAAPHVITTVKVADVAADATFVAGDLWVADFNEGVVRVDGASGRRLGATRLPGNTLTVTAGEGAVWAVNEYPRHHPRLLRLDPRSGRVLARYPIESGSTWLVAVGAGGVWLPSSADLVAMERIDPRSRVRTGLITNRSGVYPVAVTATREALWLVMNDGTLVQADAATGRVALSLPRAVTGSHGNGESDFPARGIAARGDTAWVADHERGTVVHFAGGRIVQRIHVGATTGPVALAAGSVWVTTGDALNRRFRLVRVDPATGKVTGSVDLSYHAPHALVPSAHGIWVVASDGTASLIRG